MKKATIVLLAAIAADGVFASEVGAPYPQLASSATANLAVAIAETGASSSWATQPSEQLASDKQTEEFDRNVEGINAKMNQQLDALISHKIDALLAE